MNNEFLHKLLVLLACEEMRLHDTPSNYLAAYPVWTERTWALENIIWRYKIKELNT